MDARWNYAFAAFLVLALLLLTETGHAGDGITTELVALLGAVAGAIWAQGSVRSAVHTVRDAANGADQGSGPYPGSGGGK